MRRQSRRVRHGHPPPWDVAGVKRRDDWPQPGAHRAKGPTWREPEGEVLDDGDAPRHVRAAVMQGAGAAGLDSPRARVRARPSEGARGVRCVSGPQGAAAPRPGAKRRDERRGANPEGHDGRHRRPARPLLPHPYCLDGAATRTARRPHRHAPSCLPPSTGPNSRRTRRRCIRHCASIRNPTRGSTAISWTMTEVHLIAVTARAVTDIDVGMIGAARAAGAADEAIPTRASCRCAPERRGNPGQPVRRERLVVP